MKVADDAIGYGPALPGSSPLPGACAAWLITIAPPADGLRGSQSPCVVPVLADAFGTGISPPTDCDTFPLRHSKKLFGILMQRFQLVFRTVTLSSPALSLSN